MEVFTTTFLLIALLITASCIDEHTYIRQNSLSGRVPIDIASVSVRSRNQCATVCSADNTCRGFYYSETARECFMEVFNDFTGFKEDDLGEYFAKTLTIGGDNTFVPPLPVSSTLCPTLFTEDVSIGDISGTTHVYTFYRVTVNQSEAEILCNFCGLHLLKVNGDAKIRALRDFLLSSPAHMDRYYWTDAQWDLSVHGGSWRNSDGDDITTSTIWCEGELFNPLEYCARLSPTCDFKLMDKECSDRRFSVICE